MPTKPRPRSVAIDEGDRTVPWAGHVHAHHHPIAHRHAGPEDTVSVGAETAALLVEAALLAFAVGILLRGIQGSSAVVGDLAINFLAICLEALPFMILGALIGGLIESFVPEALVSKTMAGRSIPAVFAAGAVGIVFPVCECAIVPIVRRLIGKGVPFPAALAFLLGGPIVNPIVAVSTWMAYRGSWGMVATRMVLGYVIAVSVALLVGALFRDKRRALVAQGHEHHCGCAHCTDHHGGPTGGFFGKLVEAVAHARDDFFSVAKFFIIGAFIAAFARATIDVETCRGLFSSPFASILVMMGLAVALNLCSETDAFIAAGFRGVFPETAQMAFMLLGPMLDFKLVLANLTIFRKRVIVVLTLLTAGFVLGWTLVLHFGLGGVPGVR